MHVLLLDRSEWTAETRRTRSLRAWVERLVEDGHDVSAFVPAPSPQLPPSVTNLGPRLPGWSWRAERRFASSLKRLLGRDRGQFDLVVVLNEPALAAARLTRLVAAAGLPYLYHVTAVQPEFDLAAGGSQKPTRELFRLDGLNLREAAAVVAGHEEMAAVLRTRPGCSDVPVATLPPLCVPTDGEASLAKTASRFRLICLDEDAAAIADSPLLPALDSLPRKTAELRLTKSAGHLAADRSLVLPSIPSREDLQSADLAVVLQQPERSRLSADAMVASVLSEGVPVLCLAQGPTSLTQCVEDDALGYVCTGTSDELAALLTDAIDDRLSADEREELAERAAPTFGRDAVLDRWSDLFDSLEDRLCSPEPTVASPSQPAIRRAA